jgi:hypothetical protein
VESAVICVLLIAGRIQEAALMQASVENWAECLAALHLGQYRGLAALLLHHVGTKGTSAKVSSKPTLFLHHVGTKGTSAKVSSKPTLFLHHVGTKGT